MPVQSRIADPPDALTALTGPGFTVPPGPAGGAAVGVRWLRRNVARFADGAVHARRRQQVSDLLGALEIGGLRRLAAIRTGAVLDAGHGRPVDLVAQVARVVPVDVLVAALDLPPVPAASVAAIARAYQPGSGDEAPADAAVAELVEALGGTPDEATAARIALLVQACDATAGLIGNAARAMLRAGADRPPEAVVAETLIADPPVRTTRRLALDTGTVVAVDLAAGGLPFGAGPHRCPGAEQAVAVAVGVLESLRGCRLVECPDGLVLVR